MSDLWDAYEARFAWLVAKGLEPMQGLAARTGGAEPWQDKDGVDWGIAFEIPGQDDLRVTLAILDAGDAGDGDYGAIGALRLEAQAMDGETVASIVPRNYTGELWIAYGDDAAWEARLAEVLEAIPSVEEKLNERVAAPVP
jgi:hypothetical protein